MKNLLNELSLLLHKLEVKFLDKQRLNQKRRHERPRIPTKPPFICITKTNQSKLGFSERAKIDIELDVLISGCKQSEKNNLSKGLKISQKCHGKGINLYESLRR